MNLAPGRGAVEGDTMFLDPRTAAALGNLELVARFIVEGFLIGLHRSPFHGYSAEFANYREYAPGDDLRYLDWKVHGRTDRYYLRQFEENTNLACHIVLDCSGSMSIGSPVTKFVYARQLAAALAYLCLKQQDSVGLLAFSDRAVVQVPPAGRNIQLGRVLSAMSGLSAGSGTEPARGVAALAERLGRRGMAVFISDFLADPAELVESMRSFRARGHEVLAFQVLAPDELDFSFRDMIEFVDSETGERLLAQGSDVREGYLAALGEHVEFLRARAAEMNVDFVQMRTDARLDRALVDYLAKRRRIG